jgi:hypothetical protein
MIGSSVNPALGRIDYSPITQGAQSAAQSIQAGGQAYGQMFANLGQQIGSGIQQYQQNKQKRDFLETQARSNIGEAIQSMNNFRANPSAYGGKAPIRPEALEGFSLEDIPKISIGKLEGFVSQTEKLLQKPRAIESFIQQQALTDAATQQRNTRIAAAMTPPQANAPFYLGRPMQPDTPEALTKRVVEAGGSIQEALAAARAPSEIRKTEAETVALGSKQPALPSYQQQRLNTEVAAFANKFGRQPNANEVAGIFAKIDQTALQNPYIALIAPDLYNQYKAANSAVQQFESINKQISMLDKGEVNVGFTGELSQGIDKIKALFGNEKSRDQVANTEIIESMLGKDLMSAIATAGLTTRSFDTPAEMKNLRSAFVGGTTLSPKALKTIAEFRRGVIQTVVNKFNEQVDSGVYEQLGESLRQPVKKIKLPTVINSITPR